MSGDASTLPLRRSAVKDVTRTRGMLTRWRARVLPGTDVRARAAVVGVVAIVLLSVLLVMMAANRPSVLSATTHTNFFPHWMAGPLGGLWPGLTRDPSTLKYMFTASVAGMYLAYLLVLYYAPLLSARVVFAAIATLHGIFLLAPPMALTDVFNYVNYGRMEVVHHLNPYTSIPILEPHNDPSFTLSNWHELLSPYGPLFTLLTFVVVPLGVAVSFWALKAVLALFSLATLYLVWRCARLLGRDPVAAVVLVGFNPIVLVWGLGGDHNDFLMVFFIMLGIYLLLIARRRIGAGGDAGAREQEGAGASTIASVRSGASAASQWGAGALRSQAPEIGAGAAIIVAVAIKASAAVLIPIVLASALRSRRTLASVALGMLVAGAVLGIASLLAFGLHIPDLNTQSRLVTNESVPNLVGLAVGAGGESDLIRVVMSGLLAACILACCWLAWRRRDPIAASGWTSLTLLLTLSWVLPWYVLWALPLAALSGSRRLRIAALVVGVYLIAAWSPASGLLWNAIGFHPEKTPLGHLHQRYVKELLN
ncbi:MAG: alpha,6-mannosyltransferase [Solirubrobacteraceae bacterium]|jgi:hypothetical protein|nr:alpha,6-mannosyltransferase [Solirubrobacteraceae bacterium]